MGETDPAVDRLLQRIRALWKQQEHQDPGTPEHKALIDKIRVLSAEHCALTETPRKPKSNPESPPR